MAPLPLLAHQGGWDEILLVGAPIVMIVIVLAIAKRRVDTAAARLDTQLDGGRPADVQDVADDAPSRRSDG